jgi:pyridoxine/pyridoxamine 5'-phosphate oxidase
VQFDPASILSELGKAAEEKAHPFRWPVLSTADPAGQPEARIVVLRAFADPVATVYSDARTGKVTQLRSHPEAGLLFFDRERKVQVRAKGVASLHQQDAVAREHWDSLPPARHADYQTTEDPGTEWTEAGGRMDPAWRDRNFTVLRITLAFLDVLRLSREEHLRYQYRFSGGQWSRQRVVP